MEVMGFVFLQRMNDFNFHGLVEFIPEALFAVNLDDEVLFANSRARRLATGGVESFQPGMHVTEIVADTRHETIIQLLSQVKKNKVPLVAEYEQLDAKGKTVYFEIHCNPVFNPDGTITCLCVMFRDVTQEKVFQKRASQLLHDYSGLIENANAMMFSIDARGYITEWNTQCTKVTQFSKNDALTQRLEKFIDPSLKTDFDQYLQAISQKQAVENFELYLKKKDDGNVHVLVNATLKVSGRGDIVGILFVGQDITELTTYRSSLEQIVKERTEKLKLALDKEKELVDLRNKFVSMASHEFRIPLSNISSSVAFLRSHNQLPDEAAEKLGSIDKQIGHMRSLIDDVLTLGKTESVKILAKKKKVDIIAFIDRIIEEVIVNAQHSHTVKFEHAEQVLEIESDEKLLRNIFLNLISNAIKFSPNNKEVVIKEWTHGEHIYISVSDKGIGIAEQDQQRVFQPFNRGVNTEDIKGTGLGLSIVKRALQALDGEINLWSDVGVGTTFTIKLKL